jgi:hypothetical protein
MVGTVGTYPIALAFGLIPSIATGLSYASLVRKLPSIEQLHPLLRSAIGGSLGFLFTAAYGLVWFHFSNDKSLVDWIRFFYPPLGASVLAGGICTMFSTVGSRSCSKELSGAEGE